MKDFLINLGMALVLIFAPIKATLLTVFVLTFADLVAGVWAARARKEPITSSGFKRTIIKILAYEAVVMLGYLTEQYLTGDLVPVVKILAGLIGMTELKSVIENVQEISGVPLMSLLIQKLGQAENDNIPGNSPIIVEDDSPHK